jgi:hypothetical protein
VEINNRLLSEQYYKHSFLAIHAATFPRLGSFEVYFGRTLVFSKLATKCWPNVQLLISKVKTLAALNSLSIEPRSTRAQFALHDSQHGSVKHMKKKKLLKKVPLSSKHLKKCAFPASARNNKRIRLLVKPETVRSNNNIQKNENFQYRHHSNASLPNLTRKNSDAVENRNLNSSTITLIEEKSPTQSNPRTLVQSPVWSQKKVQQDIRLANLYISKSYSITLALNQTTLKKVPISNHTQQLYSLGFEVSNSHYLGLAETEMTLQPGETKYLKIAILPQSSPQNQRVFLVVHSRDCPNEIYEFNLHYLQ